MVKVDLIGFVETHYSASGWQKVNAKHIALIKTHRIGSQQLAIETRVQSNHCASGARSCKPKTIRTKLDDLNI